LIEQIPTETGRKLFQQIGECAKKGVDDKKEKEQYDKIIEGLYRLAHKDHYVNILMGAIAHE